MHYVVILGGDADALKNIAPFFISDTLRIRQVEDRWFMESSDLDACTPEEVTDAGLRLLSRLHEILALYIGSYSPFTIDGIHTLNDRGEVVGTRSGPLQLRIVVRRSYDLLGPARPDSLGNRVLLRANDDPAIRQALSLIGPEPLTWPRIYDIIEFIGNKTVSQLGLEPKRSVIRRTANHYRHLGRPKPHPLPQNAPTLREADSWACDLTRIMREGWRM